MNHSTFVYTTYIAAAPDKVWGELTSGVFTKKYWFGRTLQSDWKQGSGHYIILISFQMNIRA